MYKSILLKDKYAKRYSFQRLSIILAIVLWIFTAVRVFSPGIVRAVSVNSRKDMVSIFCNNVLGATGGDVYISVMTIISSVRQMVETPIYAINEGTSPILSYNYGARRPSRVRKAITALAVLILLYTAVMWSSIILAPRALIGIFSSDAALVADAIPALKLYFAAFIFMDLQYIGQTVFKSLNKKKHAIFFSLLRKVFIVVPLTYLLPYAFGMGTDGVFAAEPVSNVIGGSLCFITMLFTVLPELKRMEKEA